MRIRQAGAPIKGAPITIKKKHLATATIAAMLAVAASAIPAIGQSTGASTSTAAPADSTAPAASSSEASSAVSTSPAVNSVTAGSMPSPESAGVNTNMTPVHYDLNRTITEAIAASTDLANAIRNVEIDNKKSDEAKAGARPHVSGEGQATRFDQPTKVSFGGGTPIQIIGDHTELVALNISDNIDITGEIAAAADQSHLQSLEDRVVAQQIANRRILNAHTVYYNLLRAQHQVSVAQASLATAKTQQIGGSKGKEKLRKKFWMVKIGFSKF